jgi:hypothetical protein
MQRRVQPQTDPQRRWGRCRSRSPSQGWPARHPWAPRRTVQSQRQPLHRQPPPVSTSMSSTGAEHAMRAQNVGRYRSSLVRRRARRLVRSVSQRSRLGLQRAVLLLRRLQLWLWLGLLEWRLRGVELMHFAELPAGPACNKQTGVQSEARRGAQSAMARHARVELPPGVRKLGPQPVAVGLLLSKRQPRSATNRKNCCFFTLTSRAVSRLLASAR